MCSWLSVVIFHLQKVGFGPVFSLPQRLIRFKIYLFSSKMGCCEALAGQGSYARTYVPTCARGRACARATTGWGPRIAFVGALWARVRTYVCALHAPAQARMHAHARRRRAHERTHVRMRLHWCAFAGEGALAYVHACMRALVRASPAPAYAPAAVLRTYTTLGWSRLFRSVGD